MIIPDLYRPLLTRASARVICPLCGESVDRLIYKEHRLAEDRIVQKIHTMHPEWKTAEGACSRCVDLYHVESIRDSNVSPDVESSITKTVDEYLVLPIPLRMEADERYTGKGVTICFIDSGFYPHPDLVQPKNRVLKLLDIAYPEHTDSFFSEPHDESWHGTMTSVVCAGNGSRSGGSYRGIASGANLVLLKVMEHGRITGANIAKAIRWAIEHKDEFNIRVINLSVSDDDPLSYRESVVDLAAEDAVRAGIVVVAAVGNDPEQPVQPPANSPRVIAVGGVDDHNTLGMANESIYHSTYGRTVDNFLKPDLIAPSIWLAAPILPGSIEHRESTALFKMLNVDDRRLKNVVAREHASTRLNRELVFDGSTMKIREGIINRIAEQKYVSPDYMHADGTSFAAPIVCSIIAQMLEANPRLAPAQVRRILLTTARRLREVPLERQGYGVVNAREAVRSASWEVHTTAESETSQPIIDRFNQRIIFYYHNDDVHKVALVGSFNHWLPNRTMFVKNGSGVWKAEIPLLPKGTYYYKLFLNSKEWVEDPENLFKVPDGFNGFNSILTID